MSAPATSNMDQAIGAKRWTERNFSLELAELGNNNWGIKPQNMEAIIPLLKLEEVYIDESKGGEKKLSFQHLQLLVKYLFDHRIDESEINTGIEKLLSSRAFEERTTIDDDTNFDKAIQQVLQQLLPPGAPYQVVADGRWGPQSQQALDFVVQSYHLQPQAPSRILLSQLELIAASVIRLQCGNSTLANSIPYNPFCFIAEPANGFELFQVNNDGYLLRMEDKERLLYLPDVLVAENNKRALEIFAAFGPWFMLLNLKTSHHYSAYGSLSVFNEKQNRYADMVEFTNPELQSSFLIEPGYFIENEKVGNNQRGKLLFFPEVEDELHIVCVVFSDDFTMHFIHGSERNSEGAIEVSWDTRKKFAKSSKRITTNGSLALKESNFIKLFIVSASMFKSLSPAGSKEGLPPKFFQLIDAGENGLLATITIGLPAESTSSPSGEKKNFREVVTALYAQQKIVVPDDLQKNRWGGRAADNGNQLKAAVTRKVPGLFNVIITLESATNKQGGEVAFFLHDSFSNEIEYETLIKGKAQVTVTAYEAFTVGAYMEDGTMLELDLNDVKGYPSGFYYGDVSNRFKKTVEALYNEQKIIDKNDPQKGRWGGKSIGKGKQLSAEVTEALIPGYYKVTIRLSSENIKNPLEGDVAFFLHDSFSSPVRYKKSRDGAATITVTAYEDFTVGAYTEDGTMLELDLSKVKGFPEGFYYVDKKDLDISENSERNE